jgi:hypothetical protein
VRDRDNLIKLFPGLGTDLNFVTTSDRSYNYNCIAWSVIVNDKFMWPSANSLDGTFWPSDIPREETIDAFVKMYSAKDYIICSDWQYEELFQKIAIYINPANGLVTHAARQSIDGLWTSKLGQLEDIQHTNPYTIEGEQYGKVSTFMKRPNSSFKSKVKK